MKGCYHWKTRDTATSIIEKTELSVGSRSCNSDQMIGDAIGQTINMINKNGIILDD
jgi:hypothetical protein